MKIECYANTHQIATLPLELFVAMDKYSIDLKYVIQFFYNILK